MVRTDPKEKRTVMVGNLTVLTCKAEGNPVVRYEWLQKLPSGQVRRRSHLQDLVIEDVGYEDQGEYTCMARNSVGGERREVQSDLVRLEVAGEPQVDREGGEVVGVTGQDVTLEGEFCSDPMPVRNTWERGGVVGGKMDRQSLNQ